MFRFKDRQPHHEILLQRAVGIGAILAIVVLLHIAQDTQPTNHTSVPTIQERYEMVTKTGGDLDISLSEIIEDLLEIDK